MAHHRRRARSEEHPARVHAAEVAELRGSDRRQAIGRACIHAGLGAMRKNGSALQARYRRIKQQRGHQRAVVAVGHQILEIAYYLMRDGRTYEKLGAGYWAHREAERATRRHGRQLDASGYHVTIERAA